LGTVSFNNRPGMGPRPAVAIEFKEMEDMQYQCRQDAVDGFPRELGGRRAPGLLRLWMIVAMSCLVLPLAGCNEEEQEVKERIRAIKAFEVSERPGGSARNFSGIVKAVDSSELSFEVAGNVAALTAQAGDTVEKGETLATLDRARFQLAVDAARASVARAQAVNVEMQQEVQRQKTLFDKDIASEAALQKAQSETETAKNALNYAQSQLDLARRDLEKTALLAPFDGTIAKRHVEPFKEVARGQSIYSIYDPRVMEVRISVPESSVKALRIGLPAVIQFPGVTPEPFDGVVSEIGTSAETGNTYPVKIQIAGEEGSTFPGMTAAVTLTLEYHDVSGAFLIPAASLIGGEVEGEGFVFRLNESSSTVERVPISGGIGVRGDMAVITEGLSDGDIIAAAGVSFLRDGQTVKIWEQ
jgi:multidrug efflux system membrane fusion protein